MVLFVLPDFTMKKIGALREQQNSCIHPCRLCILLDIISCDRIDLQDIVELCIFQTKNVPIVLYDK